MTRYLSWLLGAALAGAGAVPTLAQTQTPVDQGAGANVKQSQQYEQVLHSNPAFREKRIHQECDPITDSELHASCVASFGEGGAPPPGNRRQR